LVGGQAGGAQQPLEHRRPRHFHRVPRAVPHRGQVDHSDVDRGGRGVDPRPARLAGQQVLLDRGPLGQRIDPFDVAPQDVVVQVPAGHDSSSARAARKCALARWSLVLTLLTGTCNRCAASLADRPSSTTAWMTARISGDSRASAWPMSPYSTDSSTWSSAAGTAPAFSNTAATLRRGRRRRTPPPRARPPPPPPAAPRPPTSP